MKSDSEGDNQHAQTAREPVNVQVLSPKQLRQKEKLARALRSNLQRRKLAARDTSQPV